jgi:hypothetical protein
MRHTIAGLALVLVVVGCAAPAPSGSPSAPTAGASAGPTPDTSVPEAPPEPPEIQPFLNTFEGSSRGAWAMVLVGEFGRVDSAGQGVCRWAYDTGQPVFQTFQADLVTLLGELVAPVGEPFGAQLQRPKPAPLDEQAHARYVGITGSRSMDAFTVGDVSWLRFWDIAVDDLDAPPDPAPPGWFRTLGGRKDTERVSGALSWRCLSAPPQPGPAPTPFPQPTPRCPGDLGGAPFPPLPSGRLSGARGDTIVGPVAGLTGSLTWSTCRRFGGDDTPWLVPEDALDARQIDLLVIDLTNDFDVVSWQAFAVPAREMPRDNRSNVVELGHGLGQTDGAATFAAPPIGDWVVVVNAWSINEMGTVVANSPYYFRVKVSGID